MEWDAAAVCRPVRQRRYSFPVVRSVASRRCLCHAPLMDKMEETLCVCLFVWVQYTLIIISKFANVNQSVHVNADITLCGVSLRWRVSFIRNRFCRFALDKRDTRDAMLTLQHEETLAKCFVCPRFNIFSYYVVGSTELRSFIYQLMFVMSKCGKVSNHSRQISKINFGSPSS